MEKWKAFYGFAFIGGIFLMLLQVYLYRVTIISAFIPASIVLIVGVVAFILNKQHYKYIHSVSGNFFPLMQNIVSCGFIACYVFMAANYYLAVKETTEHRFAIEIKSSLSGPKGHRDERKPTVTINYFEHEKELVFKYNETNEVETADSVKVLARRGGLGFEILEEYEVF